MPTRAHLNKSQIRPPFHYNSGNAFSHLGQKEAAVSAYQKAIKLKPDFADAHIALGAALQDIGRNEAAISSYRQALAFRPDYAEAHYNLGGALEAAGKLDDAIMSLRQALTTKPDFSEALSKLGGIQFELGHFDDAVTSYGQALEIRPDNAENHNNLGATLQKLGRLDAAILSYRRALEIVPDLAGLHNNLGNALKALGRLDEASECYCHALDLKPDFAEAQNNLGTVQHQRGKIVEAMTSYQKAIEIDSDCFDAHNNMGVAQQQIGQLNAALTSYRKTLKINPEFVETQTNLGSVLADLGQLEDAAACYRRALEIQPDYSFAHSNLLFIHNYLANLPPTELLGEAMRYGKIVEQKARAYSSWNNLPDPDRCLRIGIVSADLRIHPVGYFAEGVLTALKSQSSGHLELYVYSNHVQFDAISERIETCCRVWRSALGISDEILAQSIREDGIDILIDLSGHTGNNRLPLFAWKPAPVQVSWLGYFATTGVDAIDYLIADPWTLPKSEEAGFTETIWRLPETRLCFTPPNVDIDVGPLSATTNGYITFGCFNNLTKITDGVVSLWARILCAIPRSRLFLKNQQLKEISGQQSVIERFAAYGIDQGRLILETYAPRADYLAAYNRVDIALDPFPYTGGTTSVEALWMGVPVLTLAGKQFLARQGVGLLMNAGLPEWVASDQDDYLSRAVALASDLQSLASLRAVLRQQVLASPIFNAPRFAQSFEAALRGMWKKWCHEQGAPI